MKVYYGVDRKKYAQLIDNPMVSVRTMLKRKSNIVSNGKEWFMDSGAFTYLKQLGKFPYTYGEYLGAVAKFNPSYFACMDWCCEKTVRNRTKFTVDTHIDLTIENGIQLIDFDKNKFVMVVQGLEWNDYATCIEKIREQGLFTPVMGVGTICGRTNPREVYDILQAIKFNSPDWVKLHCFGMSINLLKYKEIYQMVDSVDTFAWCREFGLTNFGDTNKRVDALLEYKTKVDAIINKNERQSCLDIR